MLEVGLVTYNLAKGWDLDTIIRRCEETGFKAVELRTTHAHGVEPSLNTKERAQVRRRFEESGIERVSLGTTCEYHSADPGEVETQIEETMRFVELAADVGAAGIKVRPNGFQEDKGISQADTLKQIGEALRRCGELAEDYPVSIWLEVHGEGTKLCPNVKRIMEVADHPKVGVCWNSNDTDVVDGSIRNNFELLRPWIRSVHITELWSGYPYRELFGLLRESGYGGYCLCEVADESCEPDTFMHYYAALFNELRRP